MSAPPRTVVTISSPADLLGVVPHRVGFHPAESIVVICLHGPRRRDGLVMRLDLPPRQHEGAVALDLAAKAAHVGATSAVLVCYTERPARAGRLARRRLVDALTRRLADHDIEVLDALLVQAGRWWSYACAEPACCPPGGTPVPAELTEAAAHYAAEVVADGAAVLAGRDDLERSIRPPRDPVRTAVRAQAQERAGRAVVAAIERGGAAELRAETSALLRTVLDRWGTGSRELTVEEAARVVLGLGLKAARDEAATMLFDGDPGVLLALLTELARHADRPDAAPVCTVLAWVAYAHGHGALANVAVERALDSHPGYEMALLIEDAMARLVPPAAIRDVTREVRDELRAEEGPPAQTPTSPPTALS